MSNLISIVLTYENETCTQGTFQVLNLKGELIGRIVPDKVFSYLFIPEEGRQTDELLQAEGALVGINAYLSEARKVLWIA